MVIISFSSCDFHQKTNQQLTTDAMDVHFDNGKEVEEIQYSIDWIIIDEAIDEDPKDYKTTI